MDRESFVFYKSFYNSISALPIEEQLTMYKTIAERALFGKEPEFQGYARAVYELILPQLIANEKRYANGTKGAEFGKLGGRPKKENITPRKPQENPTETPNVNDNVNVNVTENENVAVNINGCDCTEQQPLLFQISDYINQNNLNVDATKFFNYYQNQDWKTDKGDQITDWQKLLRCWDSTEKSEKKPYKNGFSNVKYIWED